MYQLVDNLKTSLTNSLTVYDHIVDKYIIMKIL